MITPGVIFYPPLLNVTSGNTAAYKMYLEAKMT